MKFILAADDEKASVLFFPLWEVIVFIVVVSTILIALFPRHLLENVLTIKTPTITSIAYLKAFRKIYPDNYQILLILAEQQAETGRTNEARDNLSAFKKINMAPNSAISLQLQWIDYEILKFSTYSKTVEGHKSLLPQLQAMGKKLASEPLGKTRLQALASDNLAYHQADVALTIYKDLMNKHELTTSDELALGGNIAMQNNASRESASFYMAAYDKSTTVIDKRKYALDAIAAFWAGNFTQEALNFAIKLPEEVIDEPEMLIYLSKLSLAANHPGLAQKYALKALLYSHGNKHE